MLTLYSSGSSGNSYKVRLMLAKLGRPFRLIEVDIFAGENRTPEFLAMNPEGRVPLLAVDGHFLAESNAILFYLAEGTGFLPQAPLEKAETLRWMFFEQHSHEPGIAAARFWLRQVRGGRDLRTHDVDRWMEEGYGALNVMERHLESRPEGSDFFVGAQLTIADIALYAHTHVAEEGDFSLAGFPAIRAWLARVAAAPGHVDMAWRPQGATA
ncbi:glutathione S-transferase family protein [Xanthobacter tagetidis]|uniref:Glutathione S-transferase family protein n=1 Tax=Xanthobacter tagetidis TaxID=60216 RepID=A0A3L7AD75_9HYPH|nr:glutathione S-transferase family protein [Xanthobacter tagetidis]MBB6306126.1 glutathione S-transferase [Xanthobacter tagetidis]RLP77678.1 glutathione S-transferase family protein [Xanthobacter tagetidis]